MSIQEMISEFKGTPEEVAEAEKILIEFEETSEREETTNFVVPEELRTLFAKGNKFIEHPPEDEASKVIAVEGRNIFWALMNLYLAQNGYDFSKGDTTGIRKGWKVVRVYSASPEVQIEQLVEKLKLKKAA